MVLLLMCVLERQCVLRASQVARLGLTELSGETYGGDPEARSVMFILAVSRECRGVMQVGGLAGGWALGRGREEYKGCRKATLREARWQ